MFKEVLIYYIFFFIFSLFLKNNLEYHINPIPNLNLPRVFNIIPVRELIGITPISLFIWYIINLLFGNKKSFFKLFFESFILMFLIGFIIHFQFKIKSKLGNKLGFLDEPDGTGLAPYASYE